MKWLIGIVAVLIVGFVGVVVVAENGRKPVGGASTGDSTAKIATISSGEQVSIEAHLADGRYTVLVFYADW